jgi:hypothetical protein
MCDASDYAVGAVLGQRKEKAIQVIHYASKTLDDAQTNYTTTEKELLAVVFSFDKFSPYLVGHKCIVFTDHAAIRYLDHLQQAHYISALQMSLPERCKGLPCAAPKNPPPEALFCSVCGPPKNLPPTGALFCSATNTFDRYLY